MKIDGRTFLISGGASGLGRAAAEALVAAGGSVLIADVNEAVGVETARGLGARARFVRTDATSEEAVKGAVAEAKASFGGLHGVVNTAGIGTAANRPSA